MSTDGRMDKHCTIFTQRRPTEQWGKSYAAPIDLVSKALSNEKGPNMLAVKQEKYLRTQENLLENRHEG